MTDAFGHRLWNRWSAALIVAAAFVGILALGCSGKPVPLVARAGTTIGLAIGPEAVVFQSMGLAFGTADVADRQRGFLIFELRQGSVVVATLPTRYVTKVVPDPASEVGLTGLALDHNGTGLPIPLNQALALVDIPTDVPAGSYRIFVKRSNSPSGGSPQNPNPSDSLLYQIEIIEPRFDQDFTPFDHEEFGGTYAASPEQLQSLVPKPKLVLNLPTGSSGYPAAATLEITYDDSRIEIWGAILNVPGRQGPFITTEFVASDRVRIHYANPVADGEQLALVFEVLDRGFQFDPVSYTTHFTVASQDYYDADGAPMAVGTFDPKGGIR